MGNPSAKRRRPEEGKGARRPAKKIRKFKKQKEYHSSSEEESDNERPFNVHNSGDAVKDAQKTPESPAPISQSIPEPPAPKPQALSELPAPAPPTSAPPAPASKPALKSALKPSSKKTIVPEPTSDSEEEDDVEDLDDLEDDDEVDLEVEGDDDDMLDQDDEAEQSDASTASSTEGAPNKTRKRNDPTAFATSLSKILASKLSTSKRSDPVLSRSVDAATASRELNDSKLEAKAKRQMNAEKRQALEKGRVKDVLGLSSTDVSTAEIQELERRLKKTAQRGVVKLFNAVRAAQVKSEVARDGAKKEGVVGMAQREERASEMSKKGFLDLIAQGGKKAPVMNIQEA